MANTLVDVSPLPCFEEDRISVVLLRDAAQDLSSVPVSEIVRQRNALRSSWTRAEARARVEADGLSRDDTLRREWLEARVRGGVLDAAGRTLNPLPIRGQINRETTHHELRAARRALQEALLSAVGAVSLEADAGAALDAAMDVTQPDGTRTAAQLMNERNAREVWTAARSHVHEVEDAWSVAKQRYVDALESYQRGFEGAYGVYAYASEEETATDANVLVGGKRRRVARSAKRSHLSPRRHALRSTTARKSVSKK